jgi:hypothetical protein
MPTTVEDRAKLTAMHYSTRSGLAIGALKTILDMAPVSTAEQIAAYAARQLAELEGQSGA